MAKRISKKLREEAAHYGQLLASNDSYIPGGVPYFELDDLGVTQPAINLYWQTLSTLNRLGVQCPVNGDTWEEDWSAYWGEVESMLRNGDV